MIAVVEVHDGTGKDDVRYLNRAIDYWIDVKDALIGNEAYAILNIANEWYGSWSNNEKWRDAYIEAIPKLREAGIKNTIMVDSAGWGQNVTQSVLTFADKIVEADPDKNTMFSVHMYGSAGKNAAVIKSTIAKSIKMNICLVVGEFGYNHSDGDVDEATIMSYTTEVGMGYIGWSWKGNGGGKSLLFNTPFYDKLNPYAFYAMNRELLTGGKILIVLQSHDYSTKATKQVVSLAAMDLLPAEYRPASLSEVEYVAFINYDYTRDGTYTGGTAGVKENAKITIYKMPAKKSAATSGTLHGPGSPYTMYYNGKRPTWYSGGAPNVSSKLVELLKKVM